MRLFTPPSTIKCEIRRKKVNGRYWYAVIVTIDREDVYFGAHRDLKSARADSKRIAKLVGRS
jgi:hypothetical protein